MKTLVMALILAGPFTSAMAKNCTEDVLGAAISAEAMRPDAKGFNMPVGASIQATQGNEQIWIATVVGKDGKNASYSVRINKSTCEVLEEPIRSRN